MRTVIGVELFTYLVVDDAICSEWFSTHDGTRAHAGPCRSSGSRSMALPKELGLRCSLFFLSSLEKMGKSSIILGVKQCNKYTKNFKKVT
jgi:hypothetical protein